MKNYSNRKKIIKGTYDVIHGKSGSFNLELFSRVAFVYVDSPGPLEKVSCIMCVNRVALKKKLKNTFEKSIHYSLSSSSNMVVPYHTGVLN